MPAPALPRLGIPETRIPAAPHPAGTPWPGSQVSVETASIGTRRTHLGVQAVDEPARDGDAEVATQYRMANLTVRADDRAGLDRTVSRVLETLAAGFGEPAGPDTKPHTTTEQPRCV
ncbi:hypothetical protein KQH42_21105 [Streptomyces sp. CHA1]|uniref:hypothetical protein n=1 Tax=Streptomyces TaxID=1883 RepID=UPI001BFC3C50|nr:MULTISPECIES: hypothetical protein [unclassified Streptomyces]WDV33064.1 hypothetical protein OIM90_22420 [Streptomyces sp. AD16]WSB20290.1 hypothetical protein OHB02_08730 [Streptomyces albidoflavus]MBT3160630.1 hypothetical protein [Streptomyces sp. G11C]MCO6702835.1 hypothetical protein [Streptomyces sp. CHB9.2]MCO6709273.1 hypothetical protein [Streptomyces sp. CHA3]